MSTKPLLTLVITALLAVTAQAAAPTVLEIRGDKVDIATEADFTPQVGDQLDIYVDVPGVGPAVVGTVAVVEVREGRISARIVNATGRIMAGQYAKTSLAANAPAGVARPPMPATTSHGWLGLAVREVYSDEATDAGLDHVYGVRVEGVLAASPAAGGSIQPGDLLLTFAGKEIASTVTLARDIECMSPGTEVHVKLQRGDDRQLLDVALIVAAPPEEAAQYAELLALAEQNIPWAMLRVGLRLGSGTGVEKDVDASLAWFHRTASAGDSRGWVELGSVYEQGSGVPRDYAAAVRYYRKAADAANPDGQAALGGMYWRGDGVSQSDTEALKWNRLAAEQGCARGEQQFAVLYSTGRGVERLDFAEAAQWNLRAATQGYTPAQFALGEMYAKGEGVTKNETESQHWYRAAFESLEPHAARGNPRAQMMLGRMYQDGRGVPRNSAEALRLYREAAEGGDPTAAFLLSIGFSQGTLAERDDHEAFRWAKRAADMEYSAAANQLGRYYEKGLGVDPNVEEAVRWYRKAADKGCATAMVNLGDAYGHGRGVELNDSEALRWYQQAAEKHDADGQYNLGRMYAEGRGVQRDEEQAARWLRLAADHGVARAQTYWAYLLLDGRGVARNRAEALSWLRRAVDQGYTPAEEVLQQVEHATMPPPKAGAPAKSSEATGTIEAVWIAVPQGRYLWGVLPNSNAAQAGLRIGDVVTQVDNTVASLLSRSAARWIVIQKRSSGETVGVQYTRAGKTQTTRIKLAAYPADHGLERLLEVAETGEPWSIHAVGLVHYVNAQLMTGDAQDFAYAAAVPWFEKAAAADFSFAYLLLARHYEGGRGVHRDIERAKAYYEKAHRRWPGQFDQLAASEAAAALANMALNATPPEDARAVVLLHEAAESGIANSQNTLGWMYEQRRGLSDPNMTEEQSLAEAARWYRRAAEQGNALAQCNLANFYTAGRGVPKDYAAALEWTTKAANQGFARAQHKLGLIIWFGEGVAKNDEKAVGWFRLAANQGYADSQFALGVCYEQGRGVPRDRGKASEWYQKAAAQGHGDATRALKNLEGR